MRQKTLDEIDSEEERLEEGILSELYPAPRNSIEQALFKKKYSFGFIDGDGRRNTWTIDTPLEIRYILEAIEKELSDRELAIQIACPKEVAKKAMIKVRVDRDRVLKKMGLR